MLTIGPIRIPSPQEMTAEELDIRDRLSRPGEGATSGTSPRRPPSGVIRSSQDWLKWADRGFPRPGTWTHRFYGYYDALALDPPEGEESAGVGALALDMAKIRKPKTHSGTLRLFNEHYVKAQKIDTQFSKALQDAFDLRQKSDYEAYATFGEEQIREIVLRAEAFVIEMKKVLEIK